MKLMNAHWDEDYQDRPILLLEKKRGKISVRKIENYLLYEEGQKFLGCYAILIRATDSCCEGSGWYDDLEPVFIGRRDGIFEKKLVCAGERPPESWRFSRSFNTARGDFFRKGRVNAYEYRFLDPKGDSVELFSIEEYEKCPVCAEMTPLYHHCPNCGESWKDAGKNAETLIAEIQKELVDVMSDWYETDASRKVKYYSVLGSVDMARRLGLITEGRP